MDARGLATLALRILAVYVLVQAVMLLPSLASWAHLLDYETGDYFGLIPHFLGVGAPIAILLALAGYLGATSRASAEHLLADSPGETGVSARQVHTILFSVAGVLLMGIALPSAASAFGSLAYMLSTWREVYAPDERADFLWENWSWIVGVTLQFFAGLALFLRSRQLAALLYREPKSAPEPTEGCSHCGAPYRASDYQAGAEHWLCNRCGRDLPHPARD